MGLGVDRTSVGVVGDQRDGTRTRGMPGARRWIGAHACWVKECDFHHLPAPGPDGKGRKGRKQPVRKGSRWDFGVHSTVYRDVGTVNRGG